MAHEILWTAGFLNERFTEPVSPLGWSIVGAQFEQYALRDPLRYMGFPDAETIPATRLWHGQPYVNVEIFQIFYKPFPDAWVPADAVRYYPEGDLAYRKRAPYPPAWYTPRFLLSLAFHLARDPLNASPWNYILWNRFVRYHEQQTRRLAEQLDTTTEMHALEEIVAATYALDVRLLRIHRWSLTYADLFYRLLTQWTGEPAQELISDVPNLTRTVNADLEALGRRTPPLSRELLERIRAGAALQPDEEETARALQEFLARHGHRAFSLDVASPTFRDDPTQLLGLIQTTPSPSPAPRQAFEEARARAIGKLRPWQQLLFPTVLAMARRYAQLREDQRYYWQKSLALTRRMYVRIGVDLARRGALADADAIWYATRSEIGAFYAGEIASGALADTVQARRGEWDKYFAEFRAGGSGAYPPFLRGNVPVFEQQAIQASSDHTWRGRGVSPGVARGMARIIRDPRDLGQVKAGEILVAPATDPAWTPVFARLAGLALERGGVLSHAAVVAREYHLPAVAAVPNLTQALHDGEWIEVDGTNGTVKRVQG